MRAVRVLPGDGLVVADVEEPALEEGHVLVDVAYGGICGSDLHYAQHGRNGSFVVTAPLTLGHEISGTIAAVGADVPTDLALGTPVTVHPATPCAPRGASAPTGLHTQRGSYLGSASTDPHTQGAFAERVAVRWQQLRPLPSTLPLRTAALAEPMAVALHAVSLAGDLAGRRVLVTGCGPIGLLTIAAVAAHGAAEIVASDVDPRALELATRMGATTTVAVPGRPEPRASDVVVEASGAAAAVEVAFASVVTGGTVLQLAIPVSATLPVPVHDLLARELVVRGAWRFDTELDDAIAFLDGHPETAAVATHELGLDDAVEAFALAATPASAKVLLRIA